MGGRFRNRADAGERLAKKLGSYANRPNVIVLGVPPGGVPVAYEVAVALRAPLDVFVVRKLGLTGDPERSIGAIASGGVRVVDDRLIHDFGVTDLEVAAVAREEERKLERRENRYRQRRPFPDVRGRIVVLVDDGLASGSTMRAAATALEAHGPARIVVAVPVADVDDCEAMREDVDDVVCFVTPHPFHSVAEWYDDFSPVTDDEVTELLARAAARRRVVTDQAVPINTHIDRSR